MSTTEASSSRKRNRTRFSEVAIEGVDSETPPILSEEDSIAIAMELADPNDIMTDKVQTAFAAKVLSRLSGSTSPPPSCCICLGKMSNKSFTDNCLHEFCFDCILRWSTVNTQCPLCKSEFNSIIHNIKSKLDYDRYKIPVTKIADTVSEEVIPLHPHIESPSERALQVPEAVGEVRTQQISVITLRLPAVPNWSQSQINARRQVYRNNQWSESLPRGYGRLSNYATSSELYRRDPEEFGRLVPWLHRELHTLLFDTETVILSVMRSILSAMMNYDLQVGEFPSIIRPYLGRYTEHFIHELTNFARSHLDINDYDRSVLYPSHRRERYHELKRYRDSRRQRSSNGFRQSQETSTDLTRLELDAACDRTQSPVRNEANSSNHETPNMPGPSGLNPRQTPSPIVPRMGSGNADLHTLSPTSSEDEMELDESQDHSMTNHASNNPSPNFSSIFHQENYRRYVAESSDTPRAGNSRENLDSAESADAESGDSIPMIFPESKKKKKIYRQPAPPSPPSPSPSLSQELCPSSEDNADENEPEETEDSDSGTDYARSRFRYREEKKRRRREVQEETQARNNANRIDRSSTTIDEEREFICPQLFAQRIRPRLWTSGSTSPESNNVLPFSFTSTITHVMNHDAARKRRQKRREERMRRLRRKSRPEYPKRLLIAARRRNQRN